MQKTLLLLLFLVLSQLLTAQEKALTTEEVVFPPTEMLNSNFSSYRVVRLNTQQIYDQVQVQGERALLRIVLGTDPLRSFLLQKHDLRSASYQGRIAGSAGIALAPAREIGTYRGRMSGQADGKLSLTIEPDFFFGLWTEGEETWFIEPLYRLEPTAPQDLYLLYRERDMKSRDNYCGLSLTQQHTEELSHKPAAGTEKAGNCLVVEVGLAADNSMRVAFGGVAQVTNFMFGVLNNVQTNYDNEFADEIQFEVVTTFISDCATCDPWTSSTDAGTFLESFTNWGNSNGFGTSSFDVASVWTNRDFAGSTIGIAWLSGVCSQFRYNALQNFSSNAAFLRVVQAHEYGHNFSATHDPDGSNTIMAPSVTMSNTWSTATRNQINNFVEDNYAPFGCLAFCAPPEPPVAAIIAPVTEVCADSYVAFYDNSTNGPAIWNWSFPGGDPSTSNEQHPTVFYASPGQYPVSLTVQNAIGSDATTLNSDIIVSDNSRKYLMVETFEQTSGWAISNPDNGIGWTIFDVGGNNGNRAMYVNNFSYQNGSGQIDALVSPPIDLAANQDVILEFEYAYRRYNSSLNDRLVVRLSTNGGASYPYILFNGQENGSGNFATGSDLQSAFFPQTANDWCFTGPACISLSLSEFAGQPNVRIRIENVSGYGNNMYVDNIRLSAACQPLLPPVPQFTASPTNGCAPLTVSFSNQSEGANSFEWYFPGGNPDFSTEAEPTVTYDAPGSYSVSLVAINAAGAETLTQNSLINVQTVPQTAFTTQVNGLSVSFQNASSNAQSYLWNFGDGNTSVESNPAYTYSEAGSYVVRLTAFNECGSQSVEQTIVVFMPVVASFTADTTSGCAPLGVTFADQSSGNIISWQWLFPGASPDTSSQQNPSVTYPQAGTYSVTLIAASAFAADTFTRSGYISVGGAPDAAFSINYTPGSLSATFTSSSVQADSLLWDFGDGNTFATDSSTTMHTYSAAGLYTVQLIAINACGADTLQQQLQVILPPQAAAQLSTSSGCSPLSVTYTASPTGEAYSYAWEFPGGEPGSSSDSVVTVVYNQPGTYGFSLMVSNIAGSDTLTVIDSIQAGTGPQADFSLQYQPGSLLLATNNTSVGASTYLWSFGDGNSSTEANPTHTYTEAGNYTLRLIATNDCGSDTTTQTLTVILPPVAGLTTNVSSGCAPLTVNYEAAPVGEGYSYQWFFPGGSPVTAEEANAAVTYELPGSYEVTLIVSNVAGSDTLQLSSAVTATPPPTANFSAAADGAEVQTTNTSVGATEYLWLWGDGQTDSSAAPQHSYQAAGEYTITLIASNACGSDTSSALIVIAGNAPTVNFSRQPGAGCAPLSVQFNNLSSDAISYQWSFPGGSPASSTEANPIVVYTQPGIYDVVLTATNIFGSSAINQSGSIVVNGPPTASFDTEASLTTISFQNNSQGGSQYSWQFGDGSSTTTANPVHTYPGAGTFSVLLVASNTCGTDSLLREIIIEGQSPTVQFTADIQEGCAPLQVQFNDTSTDNPTAWEWSFPGGSPATSNLQNPVVSYASPGLYPVELTATNVFGTQQAVVSDYIRIIAPPQIFDYAIEKDLPNEWADLSYTFTALSSGDNLQHIWIISDAAGEQDTLTGNPVSYTFPSEGDWHIQLILENSCGEAISETSLQIIFPAVNSPDWLRSLLVFPNPATDILRLQATGWEGSGLIPAALFDARGRRLQRHEIPTNPGEWNYTLPLENLPSGIYLLTFFHEGSTGQLKIIKQ